ncbi:MAG: hypothetical protein SFV55_16355 [Haliscomenobacter sp.]|uniref:hypothetical protein n=1 Tax=Haliscomenobacter sp. TaxID=2717303 RepID=UPI0029A1420F|nr:hypothetical protein [Haliscomenobacter sp.]MDX2070000.1 hypothetical protein [Haliscomenobacter sp.]
MLEQAAATQPLNDVQLMLLRLFSRPVSTQDLDAIQHILLDYYNNALQKELDRVIEEKNITREDYDKILSNQ